MLHKSFDASMLTPYEKCKIECIDGRLFKPNTTPAGPRWRQTHPSLYATRNPCGSEGVEHSDSNEGLHRRYSRAGSSLHLQSISLPLQRLGEPCGESGQLSVGPWPFAREECRNDKYAHIRSQGSEIRSRPPHNDQTSHR